MWPVIFVHKLIKTKPQTQCIPFNLELPNNALAFELARTGHQMNCYKIKSFCRGEEFQCSNNAILSKVFLHRMALQLH